jgi:hypothetical protein
MPLTDKAVRGFKAGMKHARHYDGGGAGAEP